MKRTRIVRPYPVYALGRTLEVASAIHDMNAGLPFGRVLLAKSMGTTPASSGFVIKLNSSARYGLTEGGYSDDRISLTPLGISAVSSRGTPEHQNALVEAALRPEVFRRFYRVLNGKRVPEGVHAQNLLEHEMGVHPDLSEECLGLIRENGLLVGVITEVGGSFYVSLPEVQPLKSLEDRELDSVGSVLGVRLGMDEPLVPDAGGPRQSVRIFIGHAGSPDVVDFIKTVLDEFDIPYAVSESDYDGGRPVSVEASLEMRKCGAAILVFAKSSLALVSGGREVSSTEVMRYQFGAASVLYGDRVVTLEEKKLKEEGLDLGFNTLIFERDRLEEISLPLLAELRSTNVIEVRALNEVDKSP